ncbi:MAG: hypothetical protein KC646_10155 [Candidatus Cloacimonetes bacterium]|nr:hypothetical protein [Candidatus Cloacimonadota bacterium]
MKYKVEIEAEVLMKTIIEIEAESEAEAEDIAQFSTDFDDIHKDDCIKCSSGVVNVNSVELI